MLIEEVELTLAHVGLGRLTEFEAMVLFGVTKSHAIVDGTEVTTTQMTDAQGRVLYPSYYFTRLVVPPTRPLSRHGLWDYVAVGTELRRFGPSVLDSHYVLGAPEEVSDDPSDWARSGLPTMTAGTMFVVDATKDTTPEPAQPRSDHVAPMLNISMPPASVTRFTEIGDVGTIDPLFAGNLSYGEPLYYRIVSGRDVAPGRALMFASFVKLQEAAERAFLRHCAPEPFEPPLLDRLTLLERETYYLGNCPAGTLVRFNVRSNLERCPADLHGSDRGLRAAGLVAFVIEIYEDHTNKLLLASRAKKVLSIEAEDQPLFHRALRLFERKAPSKTALSLSDAEPETAADKEADSSAARRSSPGAHSARRKETLVVTASFTAEPLDEILSHWIGELQLDARVEFAPYNQVFQSLLDPSSQLARNSAGANFILLRVSDWLRYRAEGEQQATEAVLERAAEDFIAATRDFSSRGSVTSYILICPSSLDPAAPAELESAVRAAETAIDESLQGLPRIKLLSHRDLERLYPVAKVHDRASEKLGHIPYTLEYFAALGTFLVRSLHSSRAVPYKVIAVDCDNTLWGGVVGEDGPEGVELSAHHVAFQQFLIEQTEQGMLLCLCSKNTEADVRSVFETRSDMPLATEHIVAWRVNWQPKPDNIVSLARELSLGLDSFIFIDDNPVECAAVQAACPAVLTLQVPEDPQLVMGFFRGVWAFDRASVTDEDRKRAERYRQARERQAHLARAPSLSSFIESLKLEINVSEMNADQVSRVSQLTQRTNQFNATTIRRSEAEIEAYAEAGTCWTVEVRDRFGDYGLVGVALAKPVGESLVVDTLLLSCRVLGRGVEHRLLAHLGEHARARGLSRIELPFRHTERNQPMLAFLEAEAGRFGREVNGGRDYSIPTQHASAVHYDPSKAQPPAPDKPKEAKAARGTAGDGGRLPPDVMVGVAREYPDAAAVLEAVKRSKRRARPELSGFVAPRSDQERTLASVWEDVLGVDRVGIHDPFVQLGGRSMHAVQILARIKSELGVSLPMTALADTPTVADLSARVEAARSPAADTGQKTP